MDEIGPAVVRARAGWHAVGAQHVLTAECENVPYQQQYEAWWLHVKGEESSTKEDHLTLNNWLRQVWRFGPRRFLCNGGWSAKGAVPDRYISLVQPASFFIV
jgi:hypothetical protein